MCIKEEHGESSGGNVAGIPAFFQGKNVFITGASGFIGKALVEKLLRSCPDVGTIYVLLRPKRGKRLAERIAQIVDDPLYDRLKKEQPDLVLEKKIVALAGDMQELNLGLCADDRKLITDTVHLIFHVAATVRFDESLKSSVLLNVRGTREVCQLALDSKKLVANIHVSTAFANCDRPEASEILYPAVADWKKTIEIVEKFDNDILTALTKKYIGKMPNTYCFTKNLAEHVVHDMCKGRIPAKIVRPSIVIGSLREDPVAGWIDNFNGPLGIIVAYGKGIMRTIYAHHKYKPDYIPVDILTKSLVVCAWDLGLRGNTSEAEIIQCTSHLAEWLRPSIADIAASVQHLHETPLNDVLWMPNPHTTTSTLVCYVRTIFFMLLPSMFLDGLLKISGKKPRLLKIQKKMYIAQLAVRYFLNNEWIYPNDNLLKLQKSIHAEDKEDWDYEFMDYDFDQYIRQCLMGMRRYLLHEPDNTLPSARRHYRRMYWVNVVYQYVFWSVVAIVIWKLGVVQRAAKKMTVQVHKLWECNTYFRQHVNGLSLQILQQDINFHAGGFFSLNYVLIYNIAGGLTTYMVLLIQFDFSGPSPNNNCTISKNST